MQKSEPAPIILKQYYNFFPLRIAFVIGCVILAAYWKQLSSFPTWIFSQFAVLWILALYRGLNKDKTSIQNQFAIAFWVRLGFGTCYHYYNTSKLYSNKNDFAIALTECFLASIVYTIIPLKWLQQLWSIRFVRWFIFVIDQPMTNGLRFLTLFKTQFLRKEYSTIAIPLLIITFRGVARPFSQILFSIFNGNANKKNLKKWLTIAYLNTVRAFVLCLVNYYVLVSFEKDKETQQTLHYFNLCYYGMIGYLMYLETYTL